MLLLTISFAKKSFNKRKMYWSRRYYQVHLLLCFIPLWINNYKTEYIHANGELDEDQSEK